MKGSRRKPSVKAKQKRNGGGGKGLIQEKGEIQVGRMQLVKTHGIKSGVEKVPLCG